MHFLKSHLLTIIELVIRKVAYVLYVIPPSSAILKFPKCILYIYIYIYRSDSEHTKFCYQINIIIGILYIDWKVFCFPIQKIIGVLLKCV